MLRVGLVVLPDFHVLNFAVLSVFEVANKRAGEKLYELHTLSEHGGLVRTSIGMEVSTESLDRCEFDTLLVGAGLEIPSASPAMIAQLQEALHSSRRLASICVAAFALGEAGMLDGRRATTHWRYAAELQRRFPNSKVEMDRIFTSDGRIWTSAGLMAGVDLALGLVESDHGRGLARTVAASMVVHHRRAGGQSQHSVLLDLDAKADKIQTALVYAKRNLHKSLGIGELAKAASLSPRHFTRVFRSETGTSPAKAIEALRLEAAKLMLDQSRLTIETIAIQTGFGNHERMRRAFVRVYGEPPRALRNDAGPLASF